jgi:predicted NACHT family NTPase
MLDWLAIWGVSQAVGVLVYPILQDLAKEGAKDFAKDFFKDSLKNVVLREKDPRQIAAGKAIKEFLQLVQQQLKFRCKLPDAEIKQYIQEVKTFIRNPSIKKILGQAFDANCESLDARTLEDTWNKLQLRPMPPNFNWGSLTDQYLMKVQEILWESEDLRSILDSQNLEYIQQNTQEMAGIPSGFKLEQYREAILERYENLNLESLDTSGYAYNEVRLWKMFVAQNVREVHEILPQIHERLKYHQPRLRETNQLDAEIPLEELERYKRVYFEQPIRSVLDIVYDNQNYNYVVILGDPGSGKSTLLQYIALNWARLPAEAIHEQPIPLLIELRTYVRNQDEGHCKTFLEFFHQSPGSVCHLNQHQLDKKLKDGKAVVMFDGLDEIFEEGKRKDIITGIHRFTNDYPDVRVIVTSRVIGYKPQRLRDAGFRHFILQDLEPEQIKGFIDQWHKLTFKDEADKVRKRERLQKAVDTSSAIRELAGNPLLLTMMAILNRNQELPRDRPELYNQASRVLLHQWDVERALVEDERLDPKTIGYKDKQGILRQVAYQMQAEQKGRAGNLISAKDLEKILTDYLKTIEVDKARDVAKVMIAQLRTRNFILCFLGADYYAFVHRTFLEYFCAWEFVWQFKETQTLAIEELKTEVFGKHWQDESWHEVLRLIAGMIDTSFAEEIIEYLISLNGEAEQFINLFLAAKCFSDVRKPSSIAPTGIKLLKQLKSLIKYGWDYFYESPADEEDLVRTIHTQAVVVVATTWKDDPDTLPWLKSLAQSHKDEPWSHVSFEAVQALAQGWKDDPDTLPWLKFLAQSHEDEPGSCLSDAAMQALAQGWKDDPDTLPLLKSLAQSHEDGSVRRAAVQALAQNWKDDPDTLPLLKSLAQSDKSVWVRRAAVQALAQGWKDNFDTLAIVKSCAVSDVNDWVRETALQELARGWKDEPWMFEFLCDRAVNDPSKEDGFWADNPRQTALKAIIEQYPDHPQTLRLWHDRANNDPDEAVRETAVQELARGWKDDPDTLPFLKTRALSDEDWAVRRVAVQELARGWKDDPDTLPILKQRAQSDEDWVVRRVAVQELARGWKNDPDTLPILKQRAQSDDDWVVRGAVVQELAKGWKDEPWMFEFLRDRALNDPFERQEDWEDTPEDWEDHPRQLALEIVIKQYRDHPQTLPLLQDRAENDPDEKVREFATLQAVQVLAQGWKDDPDTLPLLKSLAQSNESARVRKAAVQALAQGWKDNFDTLAIVKSCAVSDVNECLRERVLQELAHGWKDEPWMFEFLCDRAVNDPFKRGNESFRAFKNNPRQTALEIIIKQYSDQPQTLPLLQDRAENDLDEKVREFAKKKLAELEV